jgi:hypothetical protein
VTEHRHSARSLTRRLVATTLLGGLMWGCLPALAMAQYAWVQSPILISPYPEVEAGFGKSVSISNDGAVVVVGSPYEDAGGFNRGRVHIFRRGTLYAFAAPSYNLELSLLDPLLTNGGAFGSSVAISGDGTTVAVTRYPNAYVYLREAEEWLLRATISSCNCGTLRFDRQGSTLVALSGHQIRIWEKPATGWSDGVVPRVLLSVDARIGGDWSSVAISAFGNTIIAGSIYADRDYWGAGSVPGAAYVFDRNDSSWNGTVTESKLVPASQGPLDHTGFSVAASADATIVAVGAPYRGLLPGSPISNRGRVYFFSRPGVSGVGWTEGEHLDVPTTGGLIYGFGRNLRLKDDGSRVMVSEATQPGSIWVFDRTDGPSWGPPSKVLPTGLCKSDWFAYESDGFAAGDNTIVGPSWNHCYESGYALPGGAAWVFTARATPVITWPNPAPITYGTALSGMQLNAIASVPGTFVYTPPSGTVLNAGPGQTLSVTFTPTDTANYTTATKSVTINVNAVTLPTMSLDRTSLQFAATVASATFAQQTSTQTVRITQAGTGTVTWTAIANLPWMTVSPSSGTGPATLTIGVVFHASLPVTGTASGTVTLAFTGAGNTAGPIGVGLITVANGTSAAPFGAFDTPADNATGIAGSIAVSGWALDDLGVSKVEIWRDPVAGEGGALIFIGTAVLVEGARPDVPPLYPTLPRNTQAGWGYLMLTNFLPSQGNGTFRITAIATDVEGKTTTLGTKTITCTNDASFKPFGAIDTPGQGEIVSGTSFTNFGWVLARGAVGAAPPDGGSVTSFIDGAAIGSPGGWSARPDLTASFPVATYPNVVHALGVTGFNTTTLANGVHTIFWVVTATNTLQDGIGSRFFTVANSGVFAESRSQSSGLHGSGVQGSSLRLEAPGLMLPQRSLAGVSLVDEVNAAPLSNRAIAGRRGYDLSAPLQTLSGAASGRATVQGEELDRVELQLGGAGYTGYTRVGNTLAPLPIGSMLDDATGVFTWGAAAGFVHDYDLVFVRWANGRAVSRQEVRVTLGPKQSNRIGTQVTIHTPTPNAQVDGSFLVGGWAIDLDDQVGTGIDTLHVWAYPVDGGDPIFLGATSYGGTRPDVAAVYGDRFGKSGYGLVVDSLPPGSYDLAVFAWSTMKGGFVPAKVLRVRLR